MKGISRMIKGAPVWLTGIAIFIFSMGLAGSAQSATLKAYDFTVFLDDDEIGFQRFVRSFGREAVFACFGGPGMKALVVAMYSR